MRLLCTKMNLFSLEYQINFLRLRIDYLIFNLSKCIISVPRSINFEFTTNSTKNFMKRNILKY